MEGSTGKNKNFCACGCGSEIQLFTKNGKPQRFKHGHNVFGVGASNISWKGGVKIRTGYIAILKKDHPRATKRGYVLAHRLAYEEHYKCCLLSWAEVHHINENRKDNRIENLITVNKGQHTSLHKRMDMTNRFCNRCGATTSAIGKNGQSRWCGKEGNGWICNKCYMKEYNKKKREVRRLHLKDRQLSLGQPFGP